MIYFIDFWHDSYTVGTVTEYQKDLFMSM